MEVKGDLNVDGTLTVNNSPVTGSGSITVTEVDGSPNVSNVTTIRFTNGSVTNDGGGQVTVATGGGGSLTVGETDSTPPDFSSVSTLRFDSSFFYLNPSSGGAPIVAIRPGGILTPSSVPFTAFGQTARDVTSDFTLGLQLHDTSFTVTSNGSTITATLADNSNGRGIETQFGSGVVQNAAPYGSLTATLTAGTDTSPQANYVYILATTPTVLSVSTTDYPDQTTEHTRIGYALVQSAATVASTGPLISDSTANHVHYQNPAGTGHSAHINEWIKAQPATWKSGVAATGTVNTGPTPDTVTFSTTSGSVYQLHPRTMPAFTDPATIFVVNHPSGAYTTATTMPGLTSGNTAISPGDRIIVVLWGAINDRTGDCKLFLNLPSAYYGSNALAIADDSKYANYSIPNSFKGTGFLIASFIYAYTTTAGGTYTLVQQNDLRGLFPSAFPGGTTASTQTFPDSTFRVFDNADATKQLAFEVSGVTTGTTRTLTAQDRDGTIALVDQLSSFYFLTVRDIDLNPAVAAKVIEFTNGSVTDQGSGVARVTISSGLSTIDDGISTYSSPTALAFSNRDFYLSRGTGGKPVANLRQSVEPLSVYMDAGMVTKVALETWSEHTQVIEDISAVCRSGSVLAGFYIVPAASPTFRDGVKVTGFDNLTISTTPQQWFPTAARTLTAGDALFLNIFGNSNGKGIRVKVRLRRQ